MNLFEDLTWRGLIHSVTHDNISKLLESKSVTLYTGFDPTGPSLHVGHLLPIMTLRRFIKHGHSVIALLGDATGSIGDPSGKNAERNLQDLDTIQNNSSRIQTQLNQLLGNVIFENNKKWLGNFDLLTFLRDVGKHFTLNSMIRKESVQKRLNNEAGISFTEFSYSLLQATDFMELNRRHGCELQVGGSDQWSNIIDGIDLTKKLNNKDVFGLTTHLLTDSKGEKFGKTEKGAIFLDPSLTSPFQFFQFWFNQPDSEVIKLLKFFTELSKEEIDELETKIGSERIPQKVLATTLTNLIHGEEVTNKIIENSKKLFSGDIASISPNELKSMLSDVPSLDIKLSELEDGIQLAALLQMTNLASSKSDGRRLIKSSAVKLNGAVITDDNFVVNKDNLLGQEFVVIKKGARNTSVVNFI